MVDVWNQDTLRLMAMTGLQWDIIWLSQGIGWDDERKIAFEGTYGVTITHIELPPPADILVTFDPNIWAPIYDYGDQTGFDATQADCDILAFKGNQGGAWPALWP
uniref:Uncharacterized protein n=1 Tax=uncultured prokaryote TaxID=198431 RepID=A0A0H5QI45_9ZZZZ|nr:hypothetical protein [uncultured prokaryote]